MKLWLAIVLCWVSQTMMPLGLGETAQIQLLSLSVRFRPVTQTTGGRSVQLQFSSFDRDIGSMNGELAPTPATGTNSLGGFYGLVNAIPGKTVIDDLIITLPAFADADQNGIRDFYEPNQRVDFITSAGVFEDGIGGTGGLAATWNRSSGSHNGTCEIQFISAVSLATWSVPFELIEYSGTLENSVAGTNVTGSVALTASTSSLGPLTGRVVLKRLSADRLALQSGGWAQGTRQLAFSGTSPLERRGNQYIGGFAFSDGDLNTPDPDFLNWIIVISDSNDSNSNGIPNLSDLISSSPPRLQIGRIKNDLLLSVDGVVGQSYQIQFSPSLDSNGWTIQSMFTLTNDLQKVLLPSTLEGVGFWRVKIP